MLWMWKQAVLPQPWPKIAAGLPALHPGCCYRWSWAFGEHLHSLTGGCLGKTGCGPGQKIKSQGFAKDWLDIKEINFLPALCACHFLRYLQV